MAALALAEPPPLSHALVGLPEGCVVESVLLADAFKEAYGPDTWVRVLKWGAEKDEETVVGHAVAVCEVKGALWCWDCNFGWKKLKAQPADKDNADALAPEITAHYPQISPKFPTLLEVIDQDADASPPSGATSNPDSSAQQVALAAAALAKHRPVYAVAFNYGPDDQPKPGAAVVFSYSGNICVYSPDCGTCWCRARGSVRNAHVVSAMLHRMLPGTRDIHPLEP